MIIQFLKMNTAILILNITGTFLLSVEAIKIENLLRLIGILSKSNRTLNPQIEWREVKDKSWVIRDKVLFFLLLTLLFYPISFVLLYYTFEAGLTWSLIFSIAGIFIFWTITIYFTLLLIKVFKWIEKNTSQGIIGIIGFILLVISYFLQYNNSK